jgi:hypothetical protein
MLKERQRELQEASKEVVEIHVLLTRSLFGDSTPCASSSKSNLAAGGTELIVNSLNEISYVPVELFRGLHKGHVSTMIVIDARDMRDMTSNIVRVGG